MQKNILFTPRLFYAMVILELLALSVTPHARAANDPASDMTRDCFWQLTKGNSDKIKCDFPVRMTADELQKVQDITRGVLKDAHCNMAVDIDRALIMDAVSKPDHIFETPEQPVTCNISTTKKDFSLNMFFKPRVIFKDGIAVKASPGMGAKTRTTRVISWPVRKWVNTSDEIEDAMIRIINAYLKQYGK